MAFLVSQCCDRNIIIPRQGFVKQQWNSFEIGLPHVEWGFPWHSDTVDWGPHAYGKQKLSVKLAQG